MQSLPDPVEKAVAEEPANSDNLAYGVGLNVASR